ncbi:glycosyltransferase, partial [candidate division KSB1 bacterium]|nr:glycosyltransferase [candidate division KSB1 bacterium]
LIPSLSSKLENQKLCCGNQFRRVLLNALRCIVVPQSSYMQRIAIRKSKLNFVFSLNMEKQIVELMKGCKYSKAVIVSPGIDKHRFKPNFEIRQKMRFKLNLCEKIVFLCLGRMAEIKGYGDVIDSFAMLPSDLKKRSCVVLVGDGPSKSYLVHLTNRRHLNDNVYFFKATDEPQNFYAMSDCFMMTSRYEAFGQTILEALSCGLSVIAYNSNCKYVHTASSEILKGLKNCYQCDFGIENLSSAMEFFIADYLKKPKSASRLIFSEITRRYDWSKTADKIVACWNSFIDKAV